MEHEVVVKNRDELVEMAPWVEATQIWRCVLKPRVHVKVDTEP